MDDWDIDLTSQAAKLAYRIGRELGTEAALFGRFRRGELAWDQLTHVQQTLYLGGDRAKYEALRAELRSSHARRLSSRPDGERSARLGRRPDFDYDEF